MAFQQDMQLYKESGIIPNLRSKYLIFIIRELILKLTSFVRYSICVLLNFENLVLPCIVGNETTSKISLEDVVIDDDLEGLNELLNS